MIFNLFLLIVIGTMDVRSAIPNHPETMVAPNNLQVEFVTSESIKLKWNLDAEANPASIRIFYKDQEHEDVKTIRGYSVEVLLQGLKPFTVYEIWARSVGWDSEESEDSAHIHAKTDVAKPYAPYIKNLTCYDTGMVYLEWIKPDEYNNTIDYYMLYYKKASELNFSHIPIEAAKEVDMQKFVLVSLEPSNTYIIKVSAGTKSLSMPNERKWGLFSAEEEIYLPLSGCNESSSKDGGINWIILGVVITVVLILTYLGYILFRKRPRLIFGQMGREETGLESNPTQL